MMMMMIDKAIDNFEITADGQEVSKFDGLFLVDHSIKVIIATNKLSTAVSQIEITALTI